MKKKLSKSEQKELEHWSCVDCGKDTRIDQKDYYMIQFDLWDKYGVGEKMLCIPSDDIFY